MRRKLVLWAIIRNAKTNVCRLILLGDKYSKSEDDMEVLRFKASTKNDATKMLCNYVNKPYIPTLPDIEYYMDDNGKVSFVEIANG